MAGFYPGCRGGRSIFRSDTFGRMKKIKILETWKSGWLELRLIYRFPFYRVQIFLKREMENKLIYEEKYFFKDSATLKFEKKRFLCIWRDTIYQMKRWMLFVYW